jgi:hypothetical protein
MRLDDLLALEGAVLDELTNLANVRVIATTGSAWFRKYA